VSAGGKTALLINSIKHNMFNCIWLENGDAGWEYICSFRNQRLFISGWQCVSVIQCMQCSQIMSSNLLKCMYYTLYN